MWKKEEEWVPVIIRLSLIMCNLLGVIYWTWNTRNGFIVTQQISKDAQHEPKLKFLNNPPSRHYGNLVLLK